MADSDTPSTVPVGCSGGAVTTPAHVGNAHATVSPIEAATMKRWRSDRPSEASRNWTTARVCGRQLTARAIPADNRLPMRSPSDPPASDTADSITRPNARGYVTATPATATASHNAARPARATRSAGADPSSTS
jgi:hypothetical protein